MKDVVEKIIADPQPNRRLSLAKAFASEFINDEDLLNRIRLHDVNFSLWKQFTATGSCDIQRFENLLEILIVV